MLRGHGADGGSLAAAGGGGAGKRLVPDVQKDKFLHLLDQEKGAVVGSAAQNGRKGGDGSDGEGDEDDDEDEEGNRLTAAG